jgi:hypothetical protein
MMAMRKPVEGLNPAPEFVIPPNLWRKICDFLLDRRTGSVQLNVRNGQVLGLTVNEHVGAEKP